MSYQPPRYPNQPQQPPPYVPGQPQPYQQPAQQFSAPPQYAMPYPPPLPQMPQFEPPPKSKSGRTVLIVIGSLVGLVLIVCVGAAVSSTGGDKAKVVPPATAQAAGADAGKTGKPAGKATDSGSGKTYNVPLGSTITLTGHDDSALEGTIRSVKTYKKACDDFSPGPENGMFVVVDVVVTQTKGTGSVNPLDFTFVAEDGTTANAMTGAFSGCDKPSLDSTNSLRAGQKRAGKIAFDATSSKGAVEWAPGGLGADTVGSWKVG